jgi:hypothetical protein
MSQPRPGQVALPCLPEAVVSQLPGRRRRDSRRPNWEYDAQGPKSCGAARRPLPGPAHVLHDVLPLDLPDAPEPDDVFCGHLVVLAPGPRRDPACAKRTTSASVARRGGYTSFRSSAAASRFILRCRGKTSLAYLSRSGHAA